MGTSLCGAVTYVTMSSALGFCVGIGGVWVCGLVDSLSSVGERVGCDSPAKFCKFNIVSMGSRTNLGDFVLWFAFGTS